MVLLTGETPGVGTAVASSLPAPTSRSFSGGVPLGLPPNARHAMPLNTQKYLHCFCALPHITLPFAMCLCVGVVVMITL